ncbi:RHS repeat domain-containing protein [Gynuella sunshinyii]|uniref:Rhs family protein n=1 Tax=Gynuella sunshinyii YC6258 TaxID=1445510 RepID=A0A0C5VKG8_9GAMM|nr:RHS repeat-associated core domain-containing protein [Gynuella sunshinyii]AJQ94751.1 rhs family protein [Gynuella sunshinyii YC6258]
MYDYELGLLDIEADHLGTAKALYSHETGEQLWATEHEVYGKTRNSQSHKIHPRNGSAVDPKLRFAGLYEDIETGLYQNFNRYYDPRTGRYISHDPIGLAGGLNGYQYCPNPIEWIDPLGLSCKEYLYRGVHAEHPALEDAQKGIVKPANPLSNISPELHNQGGYSSASPYTSWSHDPEVARSFAKSRGEGGVLLRVPTGKPGPTDTWSWEFSIDEYYEMEVLLKGERYGAEVLKP